MPITFRIEEDAKVILATATGLIACADIMDHVDDKVAANILSYAELFDARDVTLDLSMAELRLIADKVREATGHEKSGRICVLTNSSFIYGLAKLYATLTVKDNPHFKVFDEIGEARAWIAGDNHAFGATGGI